MIEDERQRRITEHDTNQFLNGFSQGIIGLTHLKDIIRYRNYSFADQREKAPAQADVFKNDMLSFFKDPDWEYKLHRLHLTGQQLWLFDYLVASLRQNTLKLDTSHGSVSANNVPFLKNEYSEHPPVRQDLIGQLQNVLRDKRVQMVTQYGLQQPYAHSFTITSRSRKKDAPGDISFITFPIKPDNSGYVAEMLGIEKESHGMHRRVGLYGDGDRITIDEESVDGAYYSGVTTQYFKIDEIRGQHDYWLYGSNSEIHQKSSKTPSFKLG